MIACSIYVMISSHVEHRGSTVLYYFLYYRVDHVSMWIILYFSGQIRRDRMTREQNDRRLVIIVIILSGKLFCTAWRLRVYDTWKLCIIQTPKRSDWVSDESRKEELMHLYISFPSLQKKRHHRKCICFFFSFFVGIVSAWPLYTPAVNIDKYKTTWKRIVGLIVVNGFAPPPLQRKKNRTNLWKKLTWLREMLNKRKSHQFSKFARQKCKIRKGKKKKMLTWIG